MTLPSFTNDFDNCLMWLGFCFGLGWFDLIWQAQDVALFWNCQQKSQSQSPFLLWKFEPEMIAFNLAGTGGARDGVEAGEKSLSS